MKYEWRKQDKELYLPMAKPTIIDVPQFTYFTLSGQGNPNDEPFGEAIGVLYSLSYAVKMLPKRAPTPPGYYGYSVFPLEGVWDLIDAAKADAPFDKNNLKYTIMIRQPNFVTDELAEQILAWTAQKKPHALLDSVKFERIADGLCMQMLHNGSFDDEPASFAKMQQHCDELGFIRTQKNHKEIYLTDARKTEPEKQKTTLRFSIKMQ